jgi:predicted ribosomally synthesized peptide with SipW-like signal peptide
MKNTYLMSMLVLGIAVAAVGLGTYATLSDTVTVADNPLSAGDLAIGTAVVNPTCTVNLGNIVLENMMPTDGFLNAVPATYDPSDYVFGGDVVWWNAASSGGPAHYTITWGALENFVCPGHTDAEFEAAVYIRTVLNPTGWFGGACGANNQNGFAQPAETVLYEGTLTGIPGSSAPLPYASPNNVLYPDQYGVFKIEGRLLEGTDDSYAGCSATMDYTISAVNVV